MITVNGFEVMDFPAGESFVKELDSPDKVIVNWNYENDSELIKLGLIKNVIGTRFLTLNMPYVPHARQDRATAKGLPFSLGVFVKILTDILEPNRNNYFYNNHRSHMINVVDPHSRVFEELCQQHNLNINVKRQWEFAPPFFGKYDYVVAPDKGAVEKAAHWAAALEILMIPCSKQRDPATGKLTNPSVPDVDYSNKKLLVVDDICDGGYTFIQLAEAIRKRHEPCSLDLFVTHGIFSKGLETLKKSYNNIYTTNSLPHYKKFGQSLEILYV